MTMNEGDCKMTPDQVRGWRRSLGLTQQQAADALGVSKPTITRMEAGGTVPLTTRLAMAALAAGIGDYPPAAPQRLRSPLRPVQALSAPDGPGRPASAPDAS